MESSEDFYPRRDRRSSGESPSSVHSQFSHILNVSPKGRARVVKREEQNIMSNSITSGGSIPGSGSGGGVNGTPRGAAKRKLGTANHGSSMLPANSSKNSSSSPSSTSNPPVAVTNQPSNESELQLYRVLQRSNLLQYYDVFIAQGGDDANQLCEAGEEEFLEIMSLVGMASKPLHVRRLQKALQEWSHNPGLFQTPLVPLSNFSAPSAAAAVIRITSTPPASSGCPPIPHASSITSTCISHSPLGTVHSSPLTAALVASPILPPVTSGSGGLLSRPSPPPPGVMSFPPSTPPGSLPGLKDNFNQNSISSAASGGGSSPAYSQSGMDYPPMSTSPLQLTPVLVEGQIQKIADTAASLVKELPPTFDTKQPSNKKKISKEVEMVLTMPDEDPTKMDLIRKFSAIYGRFDCKRKPEKPLTLHEVSVNEAAAQLCHLIPALLTRRDELFPLARQVVRDSGYQYSKGHSRSQFIAGFPSKLFGNTSSSVHSNGSDTRHEDCNSRDSLGGDGISPGPKKGRYGSLDSSNGSANQAEEEAQLRRKRRIEEISMEANAILMQISALQKDADRAKDESNLHMFKSLSQEIERLTSKQADLVQEQNEHMKFFRHKPNCVSSTAFATSSMSDEEEEEEESSRYSNFSNLSSPPRGPPATSHSGTFVLSESGGQIIAVQNPALAAHSGDLIRNAHHLHHPASHRRSGTGGSVMNLARSNNGLPPTKASTSSSVDSSTTTTSSRVRTRSSSPDQTFKQEPASPPPPPKRAKPWHL
eukprot:maker-scaffold41_size498431-snap-gene-2.11 protein:Tk00199 transcript:maker-scaffold41_size498431-snap-gene-2.11-mRNA-1 annotation:"ngfi-a-binding protein homolog isoform x2"